MTKTAKFLVIGALAVLFSLCVLFETATEKPTPVPLSTTKNPPLTPGISKSGTQVVESGGGMTVPDVIIEAELDPQPKPISSEDDGMTEVVESSEESSPPSDGSETTQQTATETEPDKMSSEHTDKPKQESKERARVYVARKDDSFWKIARRVYGSGAKWRKIWEANRDICPRPGDLRPGMKLILPDDAPADRVASVTKKPIIKSRPTPGCFYIVRRGDVLAGIAKTAYGRSVLWRKIYERNRDRIPNPNVLQPGVKIFIPKIGD